MWTIKSVNADAAADLGLGVVRHLGYTTSNTACVTMIGRAWTRLTSTMHYVYLLETLMIHDHHQF